ncbi:hypothetical protein IWX87_002094 [Polaromonas sp. CG_9.7]|nr:hypothetical protein [Polaromonas sp. CG_9.7]MBG6114236.1 hypothetical protein [Polaromonas sp. CG_9.2]MDH6182806.1 hypothetical protein [Polaromonas sp. CG_23.6]
MSFLTITPTTPVGVFVSGRFLVVGESGLFWPCSVSGAALGDAGDFGPEVSQPANGNRLLFRASVFVLIRSCPEQGKRGGLCVVAVNRREFHGRWMVQVNQLPRPSLRWG